MNRILRENISTGSMMLIAGILIAVAVIASAWIIQSSRPEEVEPPTASMTVSPPGRALASPRRERDFRIVHVFVALCDNRNQGIARVPEALGNGQVPEGNLYWGARYGVKTFFARSSHWTEVNGAAPSGRPAVLRRKVFRHQSDAGPVYLIADAYDGARMKEALQDFLHAASGIPAAEAEVSGQAVQADGYADLVCFVGHNGLLDMKQPPGFGTVVGEYRPRGAVVLACYSQAYFERPLRAVGSMPLITTSGTMAPEAYTLDAIVRSWAADDAPQAIRKKAGAAYAKYQGCSLQAAEKLFIAPKKP